MPKFVRYRGAGKVPVSRTKVVPGQQGKKDLSWKSGQGVTGLIKENISLFIVESLRSTLNPLPFRVG